MNLPMKIANRVKVLGLALIVFAAYGQNCSAQDRTGFTINLKSEMFLRNMKSGGGDWSIKENNFVVIPSVGYRFSPHHQLNLGFFAFSASYVAENENTKFFTDQESYGVSLEYQGIVPIWKQLNFHYSLDLRNHWGLDTSANYNKLAQYATNSQLQKVYTGEIVGQVGLNFNLGEQRRHRIILGIPILKASYTEMSRKPGIANILTREMQFSSFRSPALILGYQFVLN